MFSLVIKNVPKNDGTERVNCIKSKISTESVCGKDMYMSKERLYDDLKWIQLVKDNLLININDGN